VARWHNRTKMEVAGSFRFVLFCFSARSLARSDRFVKKCLRSSSAALVHARALETQTTQMTQTSFAASTSPRTLCAGEIVLVHLKRACTVRRVYYSTAPDGRSSELRLASCETARPRLVVLRTLTALQNFRSPCKCQASAVTNYRRTGSSRFSSDVSLFSSFMLHAAKIQLSE
jgi:hypothetical protein